MQTKSITVNGKPFTAKEVTLAFYPEIMGSFRAMRSENLVEKRDAVYVLLEKCADVPEEDRKACTLQEMNAALEAFSEVNGISLPKAPAAAPKAAEEPEMPEPSPATT